MSIVHCRFVVFQECSFVEHWPIFLKTVLLVSISLLYLHVTYGVRVHLNPSIHTEVIDREVYTRSGLRLVYYKQRLRRLSTNKRKLVWKVLQTRLTLFVFFRCLSFGLYILKSSLVRPVLGNIKYKNNKKKNSVNCHFIFSCTLVRWFILVCTVA